MLNDYEKKNVFFLVILNFYLNFVALRRYEATQWLENQVGPLGISHQPTERELVSCLRNGLILCKAINKIHPGAVPKVLQFDCILND